MSLITMKEIRWKLIYIGLLCFLVLIPLQVHCRKHYPKVCGLNNRKALKCRNRETFNCSHKVHYDTDLFILLNRSEIATFPPIPPSEIPVAAPRRRRTKPLIRTTPLLSTTMEPSTLITTLPTSTAHSHPTVALTETIPNCGDRKCGTTRRPSTVTTPEPTTEPYESTTIITSLEPTTTEPELTTQPQTTAGAEGPIMDPVCPVVVGCEDACCNEDIFCVFKDGTQKYAPRDEKVATGKWLGRNGTILRHEVAQNFADIRRSFLYEFSAILTNDSRAGVVAQSDNIDTSYRLHQNKLKDYFEEEMVNFTRMVQRVIAESALEREDFINITNLLSDWREKFEEDFALEKIQLRESMIRLKIDLYIKYRKTQTEEKMTLEPHFLTFFSTLRKIVDKFEVKLWSDLSEEYNETIAKTYRQWDPIRGHFIRKKPLYRILVIPHITLLKRMNLPVKRIKKVIQRPSFAAHILDSVDLWVEPSMHLLTTFTQSLQFKMEAMVKINNTKTRFARSVYKLYCKHKMASRAGLNYLADKMFDISEKRINDTTKRLSFLLDNYTDSENDSTVEGYENHNVNLLLFTKGKIWAMDKKAKTEMRATQAKIASGLLVVPTTFMPDPFDIDMKPRTKRHLTTIDEEPATTNEMLTTRFLLPTKYIPVETTPFPTPPPPELPAEETTQQLTTLATLHSSTLMKTTQVPKSTKRLPTTIRPKMTLAREAFAAALGRRTTLAPKATTTTTMRAYNPNVVTKLLILDSEIEPLESPTNSDETPGIMIKLKNAVDNALAVINGEPKKSKRKLHPSML